MIIRAFIFCVGVSGALGAAQFPAYSQQYMQRLGGAVAALDVVVSDFDASAAAAGLTRQDALAQMQGTDFLDRRQKDMQRTFERHAALKSDLAVLEGLGPFMRAYRSGHLMDSEIAAGAWRAFQPGLPLNLASALFAVAGFVLAGLAAGLLVRIVRPTRRRRALPA